MGFFFYFISQGLLDRPAEESISSYISIELLYEAMVSVYLFIGEKLHDEMTELGLQLRERSPLVGHLLTHTLAAWSR